jgi:Ser-tRNA(Ala) deacylase AlaX
VYKSSGSVVHELEREAPPASSRVTGVIDWERRYRLMRMHTGLHVLGAIFYTRLKALVTGNQIGVDKSRVDLSLEEFNRELVEEVFDEANRVLNEGREVKIYYLTREEAFKIPGIVKLAKAMPPQVDKLRIVEIVGVDIQADGGPHVSNTREVGRLVLLKTESKGRRNKRVYFTLED